MIGKLEARTVEATNRRAVRLINDAARHTHTVTADNGTEFHGYDEIEAATGSTFYFATPYHSWERGTSENTNGLIRQYLPKRHSMARITPSRSPPGVSKDDFEAIVRRLDVELGYVSKHVGTHVRENDAFAFELRAMLHER